VEFTDVVRSRRMVRNYTDEPVGRDTLDRILDVARRAPSAGHSQGQAFVVVTDAERRSRIAELAGEAQYVAKGFDPWISRAPVHVVVCVSKSLYLERYSEPDKGDGSMGDESAWPIPYWWVDAGAAMMLLLLAAVDEGLAAGFLGSHRMPELKMTLDIPDHVEPIGIVTLGHPAPDRRSGSLGRGRRPRRRVVHHEQWHEESDGS
jgi:nitroreductase